MLRHLLQTLELFYLGVFFLKLDLLSKKGQCSFSLQERVMGTLFCVHIAEILQCVHAVVAYTLLRNQAHQLAFIVVQVMMIGNVNSVIEVLNTSQGVGSRELRRKSLAPFPVIPL
jgi:hypothetical protein